jgi:hypothetical protein
MSKGTARSRRGSRGLAVLCRSGLALRVDVRRLLLRVAGAALCLFLGVVPAHAVQDGVGSEIIPIGPAAGTKMDVGTGKFIVTGDIGNVGINSTVPQAKLDVEGSAYFGNGNIGVGSSAPSQKIDVVGTVKATAFSGDGSALTGLSSVIGWTKTGTNVYVTTGTDNVGVGSSVPRTKLDVQGTAYVNGNIGIGTTSPQTLLHLNDGNPQVVSFDTDGAIGPTRPAWLFGANGANFLIRTTSDFSAYSSKLLIDYNGNVGINSTVPQAKLDVQGTAYFNGNVGIGTTAPLAPLHVSAVAANFKGVLDVRDMANTKASGAINPYISLFGSDEGSGSTNRAGYVGISGADFYVADEMSAGHLMFLTASTERMRITSTGNVGINSSVPQAKLDVEGSVYIGNGNVGLGTSVPAQKLDVLGSIYVNGNIGVGVPAPTSTLQVRTDGTLAIPQGTSPSVTLAGHIAVDTTADQLQYYGSAKRVISYRQFKAFTIEQPLDTDNFLLFRALYPITITDIECIVDPADTGESVVIDMQERDSTGDGPNTVDATITCDNDGAADDGTLTNGPIAANNWVGVDIGAVTGTVTQLVVTVYYTVDSE